MTMRESPPMITPGPLNRAQAEALNRFFEEVYRTIHAISGIPPIFVIENMSGIAIGWAGNNVSGQGVTYSNGTITYSNETINYNTTATTTNRNVATTDVIASGITWTIKGPGTIVFDTTLGSSTFNDLLIIGGPLDEEWALDFAVPGGANDPPAGFPMGFPAVQIQPGAACVINGMPVPSPLANQVITLVNTGTNIVTWNHNNSGLATRNVQTPNKAALTQPPGAAVTIAYKTSATQQWYVTDTTGTSSTTKGDVTVFNGTQPVRQAVGADGTVFTADSTQSDGTKWAAPSGGTGNFAYSEASIAAAGTTQGTATAITADANDVSTSAGNTGVILPGNVTGARIAIKNTGPGTSLNVYPQSGAQISNAGTNIAASVGVGSIVIFVRIDSTNWYKVSAS